MKTIRYFREKVLAKRTYLKKEWIEYVLAHPLRQETQPDGRIRFWAMIDELDGRALRVVTLDDGQTVLNAFPDRRFQPKGDRNET
jgi:hypothetical protein